MRNLLELESTSTLGREMFHRHRHRRHHLPCAHRRLPAHRRHHLHPSLLGMP